MIELHLVALRQMTVR